MAQTHRIHHHLLTVAVRVSMSLNWNGSSLWPIVEIIWCPAHFSWRQAFVSKGREQLEEAVSLFQAHTRKEFFSGFCPYFLS